MTRRQNMVIEPGPRCHVQMQMSPSGPNQPRSGVVRFAIKIRHSTYQLRPAGVGRLPPFGLWHFPLLSLAEESEGIPVTCRLMPPRILWWTWRAAMPLPNRRVKSSSGAGPLQAWAWWSRNCCAPAVAPALSVPQLSRRKRRHEGRRNHI